MVDKPAQRRRAAISSLEILRKIKILELFIKMIVMGFLRVLLVLNFVTGEGKSTKNTLTFRRYFFV